jgi:hypothetical protein
MAKTSLDPTTIGQLKKLFLENDDGKNTLLKSGRVKLAGGKAVVRLPIAFENFKPFVQGIGSKSNPSIGDVVFSGSGLDDATSGGSYTGALDATFTVQIDGTGTPDTFKWKKDSGDFTTTVSITGSAQNLQDGVTIIFAATTGHTSDDQWSIATKVGANAYSVDVTEKYQFTIVSSSSSDSGEAFWIVLGG